MFSLTHFRIGRRVSNRDHVYTNLLNPLNELSVYYASLGLKQPFTKEIMLRAAVRLPAARGRAVSLERAGRPGGRQPVQTRGTSVNRAGSAASALPAPS